jgi:hypothetical protein
MKKIGFIDYYLSEWHANNYPIWMREKIKERGLDLELSYAYGELNESPLDNITTDEWCEKFGMERCDTIEELAEKSDFIVILAPSNPETHLRLAEPALKFGKRTYIDKTFAPDYETAKKIFNIAEKYGAKFFSTSALRYADELSLLDLKNEFKAIGGGSNFDEYIIHLCEMLVKMLGSGATEVLADEKDGFVKVKVAYPDDRRAELIFKQGQPFGASADINAELVELTPLASDFFGNLMDDILAFFSGKDPSFDPNETLEVMKVREAAIKANNDRGTTVAIKE